MDENEVYEVLERALKRGYKTESACAILQVVAIGRLTNAVRAIAHGDPTGPGGLEALAMAIAGPGLKRPLCEAVAGIEDKLDSIDGALFHLETVDKNVERLAAAAEVPSNRR